MTCDLRLDAIERRRDRRHRLELDFVFHPHVQEHLGIRGEIRREVRERTARERHGSKHVERGAEAITGEEILGKDDVARLLAAEREIAFEHLLHHVLVADRGAHQLDAARAQRQLEPDVAHHGRDDGVPFQPTFPLKLPAAHQQHGIAVDNASFVVDKDRAIAVAVEGDAHVASALDHELRKCLGVRRSAVEVDISAIGTVPDDFEVEAKALKQQGRDRRRRAIGAVDADFVGLGFSGAAKLRRLGKHRAQVIEIRADEILARHDPGRAGLCGPRRVRDDRFDLALDPLREFFALTGKDLDAVVFEGIVRRGDHHACVERAGARQVCDRRRRHDACGRHRGAFAGCPVRELRFNPLARFPRVASDQKMRRVMVEGAHERRAKTTNSRRIERVGAGRTANAIGAEKPGPIVCHC